MRNEPQDTFQLGELIAAAFDLAARSSKDPREITRLAASAVRFVLRHARKAGSPPLVRA